MSVYIDTTIAKNMRLKKKKKICNLNKGHVMVQIIRKPTKKSLYFVGAGCSFRITPFLLGELQFQWNLFQLKDYLNHRLKMPLTLGTCIVLNWIENLLSNIDQIYSGFAIWWLLWSYIWLKFGEDIIFK